jgi:glutathione S-transferase
MAGMALVLHGYRYSVYNRIARLVLTEKGVAYDRVEVNPFAADLPAAYLQIHPFGRVPTLVHDDFALYETQAISRYVDRAFAGAALQPSETRALARMDQIIGVVDAYGYWPLVRQVFSHGFFRPKRGLQVDPAELAEGLEAAPRFLTAIEALMSKEVFLIGRTLSLADLHLAAMLDYFVQPAEGRALLASHAQVNVWFGRVAARSSFAATDPGL